MGTRSPRGGRGTGSELPGTGGEGLGYGRGKGIGSGNGNGFGEGDGNGGTVKGTGEGGIRIASNRGIPFGDVSGLLLGDANGGRGTGGGPGGIGRGAIFGPKLVSGGGGGGRLRIVYALDISGSMRDGNKIGKAQEAMRKALSELKPYDSFNIVTFKHDVYKMADGLLPANPQNIQRGLDYVNHIEIGDGTNLSGALDLALSMPGATHIFVASDGEPNGGINDFGELRKFVLNRNTAKVKILTLAIGQGENSQTVVNMARFYTALATDGEAGHPQVVHGTSEKTRLFRLDSAQMEGIRAALAGVVSRGTAAGSRVEGLLLAGKTGTAQSGATTGDHAWFVGFAPANDPRIVVAVMIEFGGHGTRAAHIASKIIEHYLRVTTRNLIDTNGD